MRKLVELHFREVVTRGESAVLALRRRPAPCREPAQQGAAARRAAAEMA